MTTRFPPDNLAPEAQPWRRALENALSAAEGSHENAASILSALRQSNASNYGLGSRVTQNAGSLSNKVATALGNLQASPASSVTLQRAWTNLGTTLTVTTPAYATNVALNVAATAWLDISAGVGGGTFSNWVRVNVTGGITDTKIIPRVNFGQVIFTGSNVPASTNIVMQMQVWGYVTNTDGVTFQNGTISTSSVMRMSAALRSIALV